MSGLPQHAGGKDASAIAAREATRLYLLFLVADFIYRIELTELEAVLPWPDLLPAEEHGLLGWLEMRGQRVPVVDLNQLLGGPPTERTLGASILLVNCPGKDGKLRLTGALVPEALETITGAASAEYERFHPCEVLSAILGGLG